MTDADWPPLHVPARDIPMPGSISAAARAVLGAGAYAAPDYPPPGDIAAWAAWRLATDAAMAALYPAPADDDDIRVEEMWFGGGRIFVLTPAGASGRRVYVDIHGGALVMGGGPACLALGRMNARTIGEIVIAVDYRMPPGNPYPDALDDCIAAYAAALAMVPPERIVIGGASAGGNLVGATILRARDEGMPLPAACLLMTPEVDLTESGDSFRTNLGLDTILTESLMPLSRMYAGDADLAHPYLSPLFGDFSKGFPPAFITSGTRDLFLSNAVRMHRALRQANVPAELHVFEAATHLFSFGPGTPEHEDFTREMLRFLGDHWGRD